MTEKKDNKVYNKPQNDHITIYCLKDKPQLGGEIYKKN